MNIAIIGSGLSGSLAAISLAKAGCRIDLYERLSDEELINKDRTYVITNSSRFIFEKIGIWTDLVSKLVPVQYLNVIDYEINKKIEFLISDLSFAGQKCSAVGWIAEHNNIMLSILEFMSNIDKINKIPTSVIPNTNNYDLIVAADGSNSTTKKKLKTPSFNFNYDQVGITAKVLLRGIKTNEAFEILNSEGTFEILPLGRDLFKIICTQSSAKGNYNLSLPNSLFLDHLETILPKGIEIDTIVDQRNYFPINFIFNYSFFSGKYIYLGETAHKFHPVCGLSSNLCWRDVHSLTNIISIPIFKNNHSIIPFVYSVSRFVDVFLVSIFTDVLVRYSRTNSNVFNLVKKLVFYFLRRLSLVRKVILNVLTT
tara:strand:- start:1800 stop:2906 length:1107 start_codon:yes stop_codon:yes gene_type:complete